MSAQPKSAMATPLIASNITELIGRTPMLQLSDKTNKTGARILLKMESENPMASVKDRLALSIIKGAERDGKIKPGGTLIEATSGNTGIALAQVGAVLGYKVIICMPETMSLERRALIRIFGARLVLTPAKFGLKGSIAASEKLAKEIPNSYLTQQFATPYNAIVHRETTGPEIWEQTEGSVDILVVGTGTGGTATGVAEYLKSQKASVKVVALEPAESAVLQGQPTGPHKIQGMGPGFKPEVINMELMDEVMGVPSEEAIATSKALGPNEGIFAGISAGANVWAALQVAARPESAGKTIVTFIPSFGERYLSTALFGSTLEEVKAQAAEDPETVQAHL